MSLATCKDCGHEVSYAAASCPNCGRVFASRTSPMALGCGVLFGLALVGTCFGLCGRSSNAPQASAPSPAPAQAETSQDTHDVDALVASMIANHAISSVDPEEEEAQINPRFWDYANLEAKRALVKTLAMYCKAHQPKYGGAVTLKDSRSGRKLAEYSLFSGVKIAGED